MQLAPTLRGMVHNAYHLYKDKVNTAKTVKELLNDRNYFCKSFYKVKLMTQY